jgi:hypothetical protein
VITAGFPGPSQRSSHGSHRHSLLTKIMLLTCTDPPSAQPTPHSNPTSSTISARPGHHLPTNALAITDARHHLSLLSTRNLSDESNAPGCVRSRQRRRERAAGWWPTSPSSRWAGRPTTPASWPPTTSSTCPATGSPQAAGTAPAPPRWGCRAKHRGAGSRLCSRAATRRPVSYWAAPWPQRRAGL